MPFDFDHPYVLIASIVICLPALIPLSRFFFDDLESFLGDLGYRKGYDIWWVLILLNMPSYFLRLKAFGFFGCFGILVGLTYTTSVKVFT
jgi:hypothetical protein